MFGPCTLKKLTAENFVVSKKKEHRVIRMHEVENKVKHIAEGYFHLTGRPMATMTVDEYITFYNAAKSEGGIVAQAVSSNEPAPIEKSPSAEIKEEKTESLEQQTTDTVKKAETIPMPVKKKEEKASKSAMLSILQSVSG